MRSARVLPLLLALLLATLFVSAAAANADDAAAAQANQEAEDDDIVPLDEEDVRSGFHTIFAPAKARTVFPAHLNSGIMSLPAGTTVDAVIAFYNNQPGHKHTVVLIAGFLTPFKQYNQIIQNFSVVRHARTVHHAETTSFQYSFTPDAQLEPRDYTLVIGAYYHDNVSNSTHFIKTFNDTVTIEESLGTDPKTILTYLTLLAIFGGAGYYVASKVGLLALMKSRGSGSGRRRVEVGTSGEGYDPDYISQEHHKYKEAVLNRVASPSPNKKKK